MNLQPEDKIRKRLHQLYYRAFQKEARSKLTVSANNCVYNRNGTCAKPKSSTNGRVCLKVEHICEFYTPAFDKISLKKTVEENLSNLEYIAQHHKDIAALRWVLGEIDEPVVLDTSMTFWEKVKFFFMPVEQKAKVLAANKVKVERAVRESTPAVPEELIEQELTPAVEPSVGEMIKDGQV